MYLYLQGKKRPAIGPTQPHHLAARRPSIGGLFDAACMKGKSMSSKIDGSVGETTTEERVLDRRAFVWWSSDAAVAFDTAASRALVIAVLEREMIACGQATLYYHAAEIDGTNVVFASSEDAVGIHITVRIDQPLVLDPALIEALRAFYAAQDDRVEG
jgi:hypothetical protein